MIEKEIEKKSMLTKEQYDFLLSKYNSPLMKQKTQINYYFDTKNFDFYNSDETVRIRQTDGNLKLQIKFNKKKENGINICNELHRDMDFLPLEMTVDKKQTYYIGCLVTVRNEIKVCEYTICIDKNYYLGKIDYELEIEADDIRYIPDTFDISLENTVRGKYSRFIQELNSGRNHIAMIDF